jgi:hypothetical protein
MSIEETKEAIRVMQAFVDGKKVEYQISDGTWLVGLTPSWNWPSTRYRIKPTPVQCDGGGEMISELESAKQRIRLLIAERDTARRQADQQYKLREEFLNLLGTDDVEQGVAVVRDMKQRISKLYDYVAALETGGDLMAHELGFGYDVDLWNKARGEAKP